MTTLLRGEDSIRKLGSVGTPMLNVEVRVVDENDNELPPGAVGELVQRNRAVMLGYYKNPEETAKVMRGGWVQALPCFISVSPSPSM